MSATAAREAPASPRRRAVLRAGAAASAALADAIAQIKSALGAPPKGD